MASFNFNLPVNLAFGKGRINELSTLSKPYGKKALLVTGQNSTKKTGLLDLSVKLLEEGEIEVVIFDKVTQNPLTTTAIEGGKIAKENNCDFILGIGGGSIMDCAKAIAFLAVNEGDINDYIFGKIVSDKALPIVLVPTTCGTGSEANGFAVLTNAENQDKKSLRGNHLIPKVSLIDPDLMKTMPKNVFAQVAFDALCHLMEGATSNLSNYITKNLALEGIKLVRDNIVNIYNGDNSDESYEAITLASTYGGMVIYSAGVSLPHAMEHPVSGLTDIAHGKGLAALTPAILEKTIEKVPEKFIDVAKALGGESPADVVKIIKKILADINLNCNLSDFGIKNENVSWLTENCFKVSAVSVNNHPFVFSKEEISEIFTQCL